MINNIPSQNFWGRFSRDAIAQVSYLPRILRLVWQASKGYTLVWAILLVVNGLVPAFSGAAWDLLRSEVVFHLLRQGR